MAKGNIPFFFIVLYKCFIRIKISVDFSGIWNDILNTSKLYFFLSQTVLLKMTFAISLPCIIIYE